MNEQTRASLETVERMIGRFGEASVKMLTDTPLVHAWRISFLANFFTGPIYRDIGASFGLSRPQFVILFCLSQKPGLAAKDVCLLTGLPKNSISRAVSELMERDLIERETRDEDKRSKTLVLTAEGARLLDLVIPLFETRQEAMRATLTDEELRQFDALVEKMIFAMPDWVAPE
ncbi:MAG: MarR family winged helix-turn-helix transcriptional regulator [Notoacmeibacter sp.]|nr:MarR family winged helix-turn-helix transcriptional regulator [Notoacmeibacter sp.]